ncbi:MAG: hypothetical protein IJA79_03720 [Desulfovibrio sp.]|nr:hypothetical protein [Desulfovibrio sp.]
MSESYTLEMAGSALDFLPCPADGTDLARPAGHELVARLGDPELIHCAVWRQVDGPGGLFVLHDRDGAALLVAKAGNALLWAHGLAHFGRLVAEARYGADIYENVGEDDA